MVVAESVCKVPIYALSALAITGRNAVKFIIYDYEDIFLGD